MRKNKMKYFILILIFYSSIKCNNSTNLPKDKKNDLQKNFILFGDKRQVLFFNLKVTKVRENNFFKFIYDENNNIDTLEINGNNFYLNKHKLEVIDSIQINKSYKIFKIIQFDKMNVNKFNIIFINKNSGLIYKKNYFNNVMWYYDIINNDTLLNNLENYEFKIHKLENNFLNSIH